MSKVLVTGVNGFVGKHLAKELIHNNYDVIGFTRSNDKSNIEGVSVLEGDILILDQLQEALRKSKPDFIIHLAAQAKPGYSFGHAQETFEINVFGTINVLDSVRQVQAKDNSYHPRILLVGTSEEYGDVSENSLPITEDVKLNPTNPYAISKATCYYTAMQYVRTYNLDIIYAVPFSHIGPGQREGFLIPDVCKQIVEIEKGEKEPVLITGPLLTKRDYSDVRDIVKAYRLLLEYGKTGERYNLCSGHSVPVAQVVDQLLAMSDISINHVIDESRKRPTELMDLYGNYAKIQQLTNWQPEIQFKKTLNDALNGWRS